MLLQEGLADIIPISLSEQVAYLLADRASLLEKTQSPDVDVKSACDPDVQTSQGCEDNIVKVRESVLMLFHLPTCQVKFIYMHVLKQLYKMHDVRVYNILTSCLMSHLAD